MLTVNEQGFERFWGPSTIKPLNFNFQPKFSGQNIWTLTDHLFVSNRQHMHDGGADYCRGTGIRHLGHGIQKRSSKYKQFPSLDHDIHQKSSFAQGVSGRVKVDGPPVGQQSQPNQVNSKKAPKYEREPSGKLKPQNDALKSKLPQPKNLGGKPKPASSPKFTLTKRPPQSSLTLKLSQQETEILLKSLDFKVRTIRKTKPRDRSKSEALGRAKKFQTAAHKRLSANKIESRKPLVIKKSELKKKTLENAALLKSSPMSSSSGKDSRSSSGLNELVGPLPRVNWTPTREHAQPKKSSSASLKKKSSDKSGAIVSKGSKTSASSKKIGKNSSGSQDISREPSSEATMSQQKVKTTRVKIIPKLTLNNQLLKSTTAKAEIKPLEKKGVQKKKEPKAKPDNSTLWTPEKIALLDQITNDQQLKAVLMSAGDTYMKTRKYFSVKSNVKTKPPIRQVSGVKKDQVENKKLNTSTSAKPVVTAKKPTKMSNDDSKISKEEMANESPDQSTSPASKPETAPGKSEANVQPNKKSEPKVINSQSLKTEGTPQPAKTPKSPSRKVVNSPSLLKDYKRTNNFVAANKKRPKYTIDSRQVRKVEERLAQLSAEVTVNSMKAQEKKVSQVQRSNLDHLRKIIEKSITNFKEEPKVGEIKSN